MNNNIEKYDKLTENHLKTIYRLTRQMSAMSDEENVLDTLLNQLIEETGAEVGAFIFYDRKNDRFIPRSIITRDDQHAEDIHFSKTVFQQILKTRKAILSFDTQTDSAYQNAQSVIINQIHSILAFPLIIKNQVYGILYFDSRKNRQNFNEASRQFLSLFSAIASLAMEQILTKQKFENENIILRNRLEKTSNIPALVGESPPMQRLFTIINKVARTDVAVLITGENGTGKELVARAIHDLSDRHDKPFIAQYIGNIPTTILESELFGYKKGAFTGATSDRIGLFEAADGGTLFLDEIGDLPYELQSKMLRVLQNKEFKRLGENIIRHADVRILAATNQDLTRLIKEGKFREDLYYRLNVVHIVVPPLRDRKSDIPLLVKHFLEKDNPHMQISGAALKKLMEYNWPGNVRQLENILKRASIMAANQIIEPEDIQFDDLEIESSNNLLPEKLETEATLEEIKNYIIKRRLEQFNGNKTRAAKSLNISLRALQLKAKELGL
ncbi:sigma-54 interaction domain-containing protein [Caldithrix abyssi]|uniref:Nif-specific regulatory protein n=1 Tax=Caldithrix abyssi DSM 13497 TaxID=880073 RepID=H1XNJ1_CALAY|nr:sigma 54-interacting transcriptional regulator [Caldithrix abyssi]APF18129.1 Nif-specific regulatory protein [Caldithrix abyssi DSM 13497]EHO42162.1 transcriptional regulator, NifA subfamily, Fis Family [Caldithrix abyssi DSM 13497]